MARPARQTFITSAQWPPSVPSSWPPRRDSIDETGERETRVARRGSRHLPSCPSDHIRVEDGPRGGAQASALTEVRRRVDRLDGIDVAIVDLNLPDGDGTALVRKLPETGTGVPVLVLTESRDRERHARALGPGPTGRSPKTSPSRRLSPRRGLWGTVNSGRPAAQPALASSPRSQCRPHLSSRVPSATLCYLPLCGSGNGDLGCVSRVRTASCD
jgi:CheY-like chemotaxis protein